MRVDVDHPFPGCQVLLNNTPVPFVVMADDIAGVVQHWTQLPGTNHLQVVERRGWVTILAPPRSVAIPPPFISQPRWNDQN